MAFPIIERFSFSHSNKFFIMTVLSLLIFIVLVIIASIIYFVLLSSNSANQDAPSNPIVFNNPPQSSPSILKECLEKYSSEGRCVNLAFTQATNDFCDLLNNKESDKCFSYISYLTEDTTYCGSIKNQTIQNKCFSFIP